MTILAESARTEPALDEVDRRVLALIEVNPFRLYTLIEARRILFGDEVSEQQRPTEYWIKTQVRDNAIDCTRFGTSIWLSPPEIAALRRGLGGAGRSAAAGIEAEIDRRIDELIAASPFRLYTPLEARRILFGDEVSEQQRPTENWINAKVRRKVIKSTKFGSAVWFSLEDIKVLRRTFARTEYGLPKYPAKRAKK